MWKMEKLSKWTAPFDNVRKWIVLCSLLLCFFLLPAISIFAEDYEDSNPDDFVTEQFNVTAVFDRAHIATIMEEITVDFRQKHHGITRHIPVAKDGTYEITNISVEDYDYEVSKYGNNQLIRIGSASTYLTGEHTYRIHYQLEYWKDEDEKADFLAQNMLPTEWDTSIRKTTLKLTMPTKVDWNKMQVFAGQYGETETEIFDKNFTVELDGNTGIIKGKNIPRGYGVTVRNRELPEGYWSEAKSAAQKVAMKIGIVSVVLVIFAILPIIWWLLYGRDEKIVEIVEFYPPGNMTPAEVGYALDGELEDEEMMYMVFYLADKGYISIEKEKKHFVLNKEKRVADEEPDFVKTFAKSLFPGEKVKFHTDRFPLTFRESFDKAKNQVKETYTKKYGRIFSLKSENNRWISLLLMCMDMWVICLLSEGFWDSYMVLAPMMPVALGVFLAWEGFDNYKLNKKRGIKRFFLGTLLAFLPILGWACLMDSLPSDRHIFVYLISEVVIFLFSLIMQKRSKESLELMGKLYGFRSFIKEAEYEKIKELMDEDPEYFFHILPYAAVLGLETEWTKHFADLITGGPGWYHSGKDESILHDKKWYSQMITSCAVSAVPPVPVSRGSSSRSSGGYAGGASGGSYSGGGGGGGGGGAW